jgi:Alpha/beta hydrolase family
VCFVTSWGIRTLVQLCGCFPPVSLLGYGDSEALVRTFTPLDPGTRREFLRRSAMAGVAAPIWLRDVRSQTANPPADRALDIAEWSYFWVGVEHAHLARGTVVNGRQMYVEYWIPARLRHPYAMVLVHGGGGQGLDWMGTPDGRPGWVTYLLQEGFRVYVVDRPGRGRSPFHPELHGPFPPQTNTLESLSGQFTPPNA